jgi:amidase
VGADPADDITSNPHTATRPDYTLALQAGALNGKRIGVMRHLTGRNAAVDELMEAQLTVMRNAGATMIDLQIPGSRELSDAELEVLLYEFKHGLNVYLAQRGGAYQSLERLIRFNEVNPTVQMPHFGQELFLRAQTKGDLSEQTYLDALAYSKTTSQSILDNALNSESLDAIVAPSNGPGWLIDLENGDNGGSVNYVSSAGLSAISGYPSITVPAGYINGVPVGISFMGGAFSEAQLLGIAYDFERLSAARQDPAIAR